MVYVAIFGAILVLIGNNTKTRISKPLLISGLILTPIGLILMWIYR
ncbi:MAG: hypothetical protein ACM3YE_05475 [Bacteroidota bacterium]